MKNPLIGVVVGFIVLTIVFGGIETAVRRRWIGGRAPDFPTRKRTRRELIQDITYWAMSPLLSRALTEAAIAVVLVTLAWQAGTGDGEAGVKAMIQAIQARSPIARLPIAVQVFLGFALADLIGYATHRLFHKGSLWRFHAIHHASQKLDWMASTRLHPLNELVSRLATTMPLVFLGFNLVALGSVASAFTFYAIFLHADVPWSYGPLKYVIASPRFHRWHHTSAAEGRDKNFAGLFPIWDILFGTFYMPAHEPTVFGVDDAVPTGIVQQMIWPFRSKTVVADATYASRPAPDRIS